MSRICIKNLSNTVNEKQLTNIFNQKGEITDIKIIKTKDGKSRRLAFIGYRTSLQATEAFKHFNNTFIGLSKIIVEIAKKYNHNNDTLLKTKHNKNNLNKQINTDTRKIKEAQNDSIEMSLEANKNVKSNLVIENKDRKKNEFIEIMKNRKTKNKWNNDDTSGNNDEKEDSRINGDINELYDTEHSDSDEDSESDIDNQNIVSSDKLNTIVSDLDYLKSKIKYLSSDSESDSSSDNEADYDSHTDNPKQTTNTNTTEQREIYTTRNNYITNTAMNDINSDIDHHNNDTMNDDNVLMDNIVEDSSRLFVKNLPFSCTEEELSELFNKYGTISEIHLPIDSEKRGKGFGFVTFMLPEHAELALNELSGEAFQGRVLHIVKALEKPSSDANPNNNSNTSNNNSYKNTKLSSFQQKKEEERKKFLNRKEGWNSAYIRSDTVVETLATRHGMSSSDILDTTKSGGEIAVRLAVGESQIVLENKEFFQNHGIDIDALESNFSQQRAIARSKTTLLVKNLPPNTQPEELESMFARYGIISSFILAPSKTLLVVDFVEPSEARAAQKGLSYRNYKHSPLYLEWAPLNIITTTKKPPNTTTSTDTTQKSNDSKNDNTNATTSTNNTNNNQNNNKDMEDEDEMNYSSLFIKNINFTTTETSLKNHILQLGVDGLRTVLIQKKMIGRHLLSQGYGFIEFRNAISASKGLTKIHGSLLDSHTLDVKPSDKRITTIPISKTNNSNSSNTNTANNAKNNTNMNANNNKLIVRNVAFQATKSELHDLFSIYGSVKRVRIPKKMGGEHRGFAFIDFSTAQEAAIAMSSLKNTHLYGRHLVLEWANDESEENQFQSQDHLFGNSSSLDKLRKKARGDVQVINEQNKRQKLINDKSILEKAVMDNVTSDDI